MSSTCFFGLTTVKSLAGTMSHGVRVMTNGSKGADSDRVAL